MGTVREFNQYTKQQIQPFITQYPIDYQNFMQAMWQGEWLENYASIDFIENVLSGMAKRRPKLFLLKENIIDIQQNYSELKALFAILYPKISTAVVSSKFIL